MMNENNTISGKVVVITSANSGRLFALMRGALKERQFACQKRQGIAQRISWLLTLTVVAH